MKTIFLILTVVLTTACADNSGTVVPGPQGPAGPAGSNASTPSTTVEQIVAAENVYRESLGETALSLGLSCTVQAIASGTYLSSASPGYTAAQAIVVTGPSYPYLLTVAFDQLDSNPGPNSVIDPSIQSLFLNNNYKIVCSGQLIVTEDGYHNFSMSSDDGSILTIDGTTVISNDGSHSISTVTGTKNLESAVTHTFSLQYAQSGLGQFALVLDMNGALLPAANFYH